MKILLHLLVLQTTLLNAVLAEEIIREATDPFADLPTPPAKLVSSEDANSHGHDLLIRKEYGFFLDKEDDFSSSLFAGGEILKRFSTPNKTWGAINYQGGIIVKERKKNQISSAREMEPDKDGLSYQSHNAYIDFYDLLPTSGLLNIKVGQFYIPFGQNLASDTHATFFQLGNGEHLGRTQGVGIGSYGSWEMLNYQLAHFLQESDSHSQNFKMGETVLRLNYASEANDEIGISLLKGEKESMHSEKKTTQVERVGVDFKKNHMRSEGTYTLIGESAIGKNDHDTIMFGMVDASFLDPQRVWSFGLSFRNMVEQSKLDQYGQARIEYYFKNDVSRSNLHWIGLGIETPHADKSTNYTLYYYKYF